MMGTKPQAMWVEYRLGCDGDGRKYFTRLHISRTADDRLWLHAEGTIVRPGGKLQRESDVVACGAGVDFRDVLVPDASGGWQMDSVRAFAEMVDRCNAYVLADPAALQPDDLVFLWERFGLLPPD